MLALGNPKSTTGHKAIRKRPSDVPPLVVGAAVRIEDRHVRHLISASLEAITPPDTNDNKNPIYYPLSIGMY